MGIYAGRARHARSAWVGGRRPSPVEDSPAKGGYGNSVGKLQDSTQLLCNLLDGKSRGGRIAKHGDDPRQRSLRVARRFEHFLRKRTNDGEEAANCSEGTEGLCPRPNNNIAVVALRSRNSDALRGAVSVAVEAIAAREARDVDAQRRGVNRSRDIETLLNRAAQLRKRNAALRCGDGAVN